MRCFICLAFQFALVPQFGYENVTSLCPNASANRAAWNGCGALPMEQAGEKAG
jgi:hypothetical protein